MRTPRDSHGHSGPSEIHNCEVNMQETYGSKWKHMGELNSSTSIGCLAQEDFENSF